MIIKRCAGGIFLFCMLFVEARVQAAKPDWLIDPKPFVAEVRQGRDKQELELTNGVARRVIRLTPNAATVSVENLGSGEQLLRAVSPEARVTLDGTSFAIGGLRGQPVGNFLKTEWLESMTSPRDSYQFADYTVGPIEARFPWKKRTEWLSRDIPWPPPGKHVTLRFIPPGSVVPVALGEVIYENKFDKKLDGDWKVVASDQPGTKFGTEGKAGEMLALPDTCVYVERKWPEGAGAIEATVDGGDDDLANSWGPGIAIVAPDRTVSLVMRPNSRQFEMSGKETGEIVHGRFPPGAAPTLRMRVEQKNVICEASIDGKTFEPIGTALLPKGPIAFRVGKVGKTGDGRDYRTPTGELKKSHIQRVALRGAAAPAKAIPRTDLPEIQVHYEVYDGLPLFSKWIVVKNTTPKGIRVNAFVAEELRLAEVESAVENPPTSEKFNLLVESDYAFAGMDGPHANDKVVHLESDPNYPTQVNFEAQTACLLRCSPKVGPDQLVEPGKSFESCRVFELLLDSTDRERRSLAQRRMYRAIAPWTAENPLMFHKLGSRPDIIREAIEQCRETGFEMIIMTFGSGFNIENTNAAYRKQFADLSAEAKKAGVALGGYFLMASRGAADAKDNTQGSPAKYGVMPCLGSKWGVEFVDKIKNFAGEAGLGVIENDGPYPGDLCASTTHPFHRGLDDSQWVQWKAQSDLYKWCRSQGVFVNQPDYYFLNGGNKCGMGYKESNWSLPRAEQEIIERQNIYDGTWTKHQAMGWMFVPLSQYHGGGAAATIEPLEQHLDHYESRFANLLGSGTQACYRGPRLYDTDKTKALVKKWVDFYKTHRQVLDGDLVHLRRANGRGWDGWLHVNPAGEEKGLVFFYNPLTEPIEQEIRVPLYYTGLTDEASVSIDGEKGTTVKLNSDRTATLKIKIPAQGRTWALFKK